jgi:outer membrane lipoprotein SlyB
MRRQLVVLVSALALALAGCSSGGGYRSKGDSSNLSRDQQVLRANADRVADPESAGDNTTGEAMALGAVALGVLGCGIALLAGGDGRGCAIGAGVGAAVGAAGGYALGSDVAEKQRDYASREDFLYDVIASADDEIAANHQAVAAAERVNRQHEQRLAQLNKQYAAKQVSKKKYENEVEEMSVDRDAIAIAVDTNRQKIAELDRLIAEGGKSGQIALLQDRRAALAAENAALQDELQELTALLSSVPAEVRV